MERWRKIAATAVIWGCLALILGIPVLREGLDGAVTPPGAALVAAAGVAVAAVATVLLWRVRG